MRASLSLHLSSVEAAALRFLRHSILFSFDRSKTRGRQNELRGAINRVHCLTAAGPNYGDSYSRRKERICCPNTSADATCDELVCKQAMYAMKKGMILSAALSVVALMLVSCAGEPEATTTTTRQTTVTTAAPPPTTGARTTTTTTHVGSGGY